MRKGSTIASAAAGLALAVAAAWFCGAARADELETTSGRKFSGQVVRQTADSITFRVASLGGQSVEMTFPRSEVRSLRTDSAASSAPAQTQPAASATPRPAPPPVAAPRPADANGPARAKATRTKAEVEAEIDKLGKAQPDWWGSVQVVYPKTLDLTRWEAPPGLPWNPNRTIAQYFFSVINENASKWKEGARFAHFLMTQFKDDKPNLAKAMNQAAHIYGTLLGDYARSAFWYRKAAAIAPLGYYQEIRLVECYWKLGGKDLAMDCIENMDNFGVQTVKLLAEMGELAKALSTAKELAKTYPDEGWLSAGDACRLHGKYKEALGYYQRILSIPKPADQRGANQLDRVKKRAAASAEAVRLFDTLDLGKVPDGKYVAESIGYAGMIKVEVAVRAGRIEAVRIVEHKEKQYFTALDDPRRQMIEKQSVKGIDMTSGATITAEAVVNAAAKALGSGMK